MWYICGNMWYDLTLQIAGFDKGNTHIFKFVCGRFVHETGGVLGESVVELEIRVDLAVGLRVHEHGVQLQWNIS